MQLLTRHSSLVTRHCAKRSFVLRTSSFVLALALALAQIARAQNAAQSLTLKPGWNAIYVEVSPEESPESIFAGWPVDSVGVYDPAAFLSTRQFSSTTESDGLTPSPILMWNRAYQEASSVTRIPAGVVCIAFNTNLTASGTFTTTLVGLPAAPRTTWHRSSGDEVLNFFGFSLQTGTSVRPVEYLAGFSALSGANFKRIGGKKRGESPSEIAFYASDTVSDGDVLLVSASAPSDWSGSLWVSPMDGLDFGTNATLRTLSIRNDGGTPRTVSLELNRAVREMDSRFPFDPSLFHWRDVTTARTNAQWNAISAFGEIASKKLAAGETWSLVFGLDRASMPPNLVQGIPFGALLTAKDKDGATKMKATVPLRATTSGADAARMAWPAGLWVADVALDTVDFSTSEDPAPAGSTLKLRLPLHVAADGTIRLLQRVVAAGETDANGTLSYRLYAGTAEPPSTALQATRISSAVLPTEKPVIEAGMSSLSTDFAYALFRFTVDADGATSLLRHPYHPQHDGLRWDFSTPAPSGDDIANYKGEVKPELFSVENNIFLMLDFKGGAARWDPQNTVTGTCTWSFKGLRREGNLVASGPMTLKRVSQLAEITLE